MADSAQGTTFQRAPDARAHVDADGRFRYVDDAMTALLGHDPADLLRLRFHDITHPKDLLRDEAQFERLLAQGWGAYSILKRYFNVTGDPVWAELNVELNRTGPDTPPLMLARVRPVCTSNSLLDDLHTRAMHDPLTGLLNHGQMEEQLVCSERQALRIGRRFAVLVFDLDGFKLVNDTYGHAAGDHVLQAIARRIDGIMETDDLVGRVGGDEFMVLLRDLDRPGALARARARLRMCLAHPFRLPCGPVRLTASAGSAVYPDHATTLPRLLARADAALYTEKCRRFGAQWQGPPG